MLHDAIAGDERGPGHARLVLRLVVFHAARGDSAATAFFATTLCDMTRARRHRYLAAVQSRSAPAEFDGISA